jgi:hypothetical protein
LAIIAFQFEFRVFGASLAKANRRRQSQSEATMTHVYFHCSSAEKLVLDPRGVDVEDFIEAHQRATQVVQDFIRSLGPHDWRTWTLHVSDEDGEEIFLMPFACLLGKPH